MKRSTTKFSPIIFYLIIFLSCNRADKPQFDKIIFHTTMCFGPCPIFHLELNKNKNVKLFAQSVPISKENWQTDTSKTGYFEGKVSDSIFRNLSTIIKSIGIDTLTFNHVICCDGSVYTIIIYRNGKRKFFRSMNPPAKAGPLIGTLYQICKESNLIRSLKPFEIENEYSPSELKIKFPPGYSTKR